MVKSYLYVQFVLIGRIDSLTIIQEVRALEYLRARGLGLVECDLGQR